MAIDKNGVMACWISGIPGFMGGCVPGWRLWALVLLPIVIALLVLATRRGGLRALPSIRLRGLSLIWAAAVVQFIRISDPVCASAVLRPGDGVLPVVLIWLLGVVFVAVNLRSRSKGVRLGLGIFALGFTLNTVTIALNGGMPLSAWAAHYAGFSERAIAPRTRHRRRPCCGSSRMPFPFQRWG